MKNLVYLLLLILITSCQTVSKKIDEKVSAEEANLSKWLNKSEQELKLEFGDPNKIKLKNNSKNKYFVYTHKKLKIKCERIFEINQKNKVIGFSSKNCF